MRVRGLGAWLGLTYILLREGEGTMNVQGIVKELFPELAATLDAAITIKDRDGTTNRPTVGPGGFIDTDLDLQIRLAKLMTALEARIVSEIGAGLPSDPKQATREIAGILGHPMTLMFMVGVLASQTKTARLVSPGELLGHDTN